MPDKDAGTPRVYLARHGDQSPLNIRFLNPPLELLTQTKISGETEWTKNGRYTGITELDLTEDGVQQVRGSGQMVVGPGKLIDPAQLAHVFISPRKRAQMTFGLLFDGAGKDALEREGKISTTEELAEWDYGRYEGLLTEEIRARRKEQGLDQDRPWDIWRDGCESGE